MRQAEMGRDKFHQQQQRFNTLQPNNSSGNSRSVVRSEGGFFFIDTPARMVRENRFAACNFFTANKVILRFLILHY